MSASGKVAALGVLVATAGLVFCGAPEERPGARASRGEAGERKGEAREKPMEWRELSAEERRVLVDKGTERPFSGKYWDHHQDGTYRCRRCRTPLFRSGAKFDSGTGWPSFDDALPGAVREVPDADGRRTEIVCAACDAHLGHVFRGEGLTPRDTRHCVNSICLDFEAAAAGGEERRAEAYFAGGCFWGVEHLLEQAPGVVLAESGYMGGHVERPTYEQVCSKRTGHAETVRVVYDPRRTRFEELARLFFEIHDPTQVDRQGPDVGEQYRSVVFYRNEEERRAAQRLIDDLRRRGYEVATKLQPAGTFWRAEAYHQDYYRKNKKRPYCHSRVPRFGE